MRYVFGIFDKVSDQYVGMLFFKAAYPAAIREFGDIMTAKDSALSSHAADYDLMVLGEEPVGCGPDLLFHEPRVIATGATFSREVTS
ncbi:MAG: nonstructural protein [Microviridae sp.]|nr:MAG: nonstructural protein [Microviridae sp.]